MLAMLRVALVKVLALACCLATAEAAEPIFVLRTEPALRYREWDGTASGLLTREIGRQAILIAARDGLGLVTRDETLGETASLDDTDATVIDLLPRVRVYWSDRIELQLEKAKSGKPVVDPIDVKCKAIGASNIYYQTSIAWERASREELMAALRAAGLEGDALPPNPDNVPEEWIEDLLGRMNFISQYAAVSLAHKAIAEKGESAEWLDVLSRGYAHLGTLVAHHWTSAPEAFFARSLLYAKRASVIDPKGNESQWLFPYALALSGVPSLALWDQKEIGLVGEETPAWAAVIDPYSRFDLDELIAVGEGDSSLEALTRWLAVCMRRTLGKHRSFYKVAMSSLEISPDAYGNYSNLVSVYSSLRDERYGAYMGPHALGRFALTRLQLIEDLPENLAVEIPANSEEYSNLIKRLDDPFEEDPFLPTPHFVIQQLQTAESDGEIPREPSWAMLASLIEEEQFVMVASFCDAMQNATETSHAEEVAALLELIGEHRFRDYIAMYQFSKSERKKRRDEIIGDLVITDPQPKMRLMLYQAAYVKEQPGIANYYLRTAYAEAAWLFDYRLPSMADRLREVEIGWGAYPDKESWKFFCRMFKKISPHSPHWLREEMRQTKEPSDEQLEDWARIAGKDIITCHGMAKYYAERDRTEEAIDWYERAYKLAPSDRTTIELAKLLRVNGHRDRWLPTLERFLDTVENRGLEHSEVQKYIANTYMNRDFPFGLA